MTRKRMTLGGLSLVAIMGVLSIARFSDTRPANAEESADSQFARTTIDLGVCVSDVEKSAKFYTDVVGFKELEGFSVPAEFCKDAGLTDSKDLNIRVFALGEGDSATKLKLMSVPGVETKKSSNDYVHSQLGFRYLTIMVNDTSAVLKRLEKAGIKPAAKTPIALPGNLPQGVYFTLVRDPDGNLIELIGPKK